MTKPNDYWLQTERRIEKFSVPEDVQQKGENDETTWAVRKTIYVIKFPAHTLPTVWQMRMRDVKPCDCEDER